MVGIEKYIKTNPIKKNYKFGRKYNNSLLALNNNKPKFRARTNIVHYEKNNKGDVIGMVIKASPKEFKSLTKDLFFCFPAPLGKPYSEKVLDEVLLEDVINYCDPSLGIDLESDPDVAKLKLRVKLSQLGWEIDDVAK